MLVALATTMVKAPEVPVAVVVSVKKAAIEYTDKKSSGADTYLFPDTTVPVTFLRKLAI
jgi:hypothetical protein